MTASVVQTMIASILSHHTTVTLVPSLTFHTHNSIRGVFKADHELYRAYYLFQESPTSEPRVTFSPTYTPDIREASEHLASLRKACTLRGL